MLMNIISKPEVEDVDAAGNANLALQRRYPDGVVTLVLVPLSTPLPGNAVREGGSSWIKRLGPGVRTCGVVVGGKGFWTAAARSAVNTIFLLARPIFPAKIFATVDDAAAWCAERCGRSEVTTAGLIAAATRLQRESLPPPAAPG